MRLFWVKKQDAEAADSSWTLPFSDMMSLLLAVFVMIAAMSELRRDARFTRVSSAVRSSFGFGTDDAPGNRTDSSGRSSLAETLERAGLMNRSGGSLEGPADPELSAVCEVTTGKDQVAIEIAGGAAFEPFGAQLLPQARNAVARIAAFLAEGQARLEVRGYGGDGSLPRHSPFRDTLDLSYARARAVADLLVASGVPRLRVYVTACGEHQTTMPSGPDTSPAASRRVEIIVHTGTPAVRVPIIAEKEQADNG